MKRLHLWFGCAVLIGFILTGQYMDRYHDHLRGMPDLPRMLYRSRHIYILLAGLLNVGIGAYLRTHQQRWRQLLQITGSGIIMVATILLFIAFFYEPQYPGYITPWSRWGLYLIVAGTLSHLFSEVEGFQKAE
jgi:hypothetical protein